MAIIIPEAIILSTIKSAIKIIVSDFNSKSDETKTILYRILYDTSNDLERYKSFEQAKAVFIKNQDDPRLIKVNMFFNAERATLPTIHIIMNSEKRGEDGIGIDQGFQEPIFDDTDQTYVERFSRRYDSVFRLVVTSNNPNEVILIYHFLRALLIPIFEHFNALGLENCSFSGADSNINEDIVPNVFARSLFLSFSHQVTVSQLFDQDQIAELIFQVSDNSDSDSQTMMQVL